MIMNIPPSAEYILTKLNNAGYLAYIVGGFLRDKILNIPSYDIDITTSASVNEIKSVFCDDKIIETGIKFSSLTIVVNNIQIQVTSFRKDGKYTDMRHPDEVFSASSLKEDLLRRDFTINCLAYSLDEGLIDHFNSIDDINSKIIKTIGNPNDRFKEDALRVLRGIRFSAKLGFSIESDTREAMSENSYLLSKISSERIYNEIFKILMLDDVDVAICKYYDILSAVFPFLIAMNNFNQQTPYHSYTLLNHTALTIKNSNKDITLRLAALFHDVGKLYTKSLDVNNQGHFYNHQRVSSEYIKNFLYNKGINHKIIDNAAVIIDNHYDTLINEKPYIKLLLNRFGEDLFFKFINLKIADDISKTQNTSYNLEKHKQIIKTANEIIKNQECYKISQLKIKGNDLEMFNYPKQYTKKVLENILRLVISEKLANDKEIIFNYLKSES